MGSVIIAQSGMAIASTVAKMFSLASKAAIAI